MYCRECLDIFCSSPQLWPNSWTELLQQNSVPLCFLVECGLLWLPSYLVSLYWMYSALYVCKTLFLKTTFKLSARSVRIFLFVLYHDCISNPFRELMYVFTKNQTHDLHIIYPSVSPTSVALQQSNFYSELIWHNLYSSVFRSKWRPVDVIVVYALLGNYWCK